MTTIRKSDSQLDAEAQIIPRRRLLHLRLEGHRAAYSMDCVVPRLVSRQPPTTFDLGTLSWRTEDGAASGLPMAGPMLRRLSESPGASFPWVTAFSWLGRECRRFHPHHRSGDRPYWRGRLCWEAVRLTVIGGEKASALRGPLSPEDAGRILRLDHIEALLHRAFDDIEAEMVRIELRAERRAKERLGHGPGAVPRYVPEPRHDQPGLHQIDCPKCRRVA